MLTPEQLDEAGEAVAATYRQIEAELIDYLVQKMIEGNVSSQRISTAITLASQSMPVELQAIIDAHKDEIDEAVRAEVEQLLAASDAFDLEAIARAIGIDTAAEGIREALTVQTLSVLAAAREVAARDNLEMSAAARTKFVQWSTWAATQTATGNMTYDKAQHKAVRELAKEGLTITGITYRNEETGKVTVTNKVDVAVQRHLRSLIAQGAAQLTMQRLEEMGVEFVEVSSHLGARPSHCEWHGRCYHIGGAIEVDGVRYEDFEFGTGYRGVSGPYTKLGDQLLGVNCRHSFAPWMPGMPRAYSPDPKSPTGLDNDEIYKLTQGQRARERRIREAKRDLAATQACYNADPTPENAEEVAKAKLTLKRRQAAMREYIKEANNKCKPGTEILVRQPQREWAGDMPKANVVKHDSNPNQLHIPSMSSENKIKWPRRNKELSQEERAEIKQYAQDRDIVLQLHKHSDASLIVLRRYIDAADRTASLFPELRGTPKKPLTISVEIMNSDDFAQIYGKSRHVLRVSESSVRSETALEREYAKLADEGWFVRGTPIESIIYHEMGHMYAHINKISGMRIARSIIHSKDEAIIGAFLRKNLSRYSSSFTNGSEIISEVFSAWMSKTNNKFADQFMERLLPLR